MTVEFLQRGIFKILQIKFFDSQIVNKKLCNLNKFGCQIFRFHNCLVACKVHDIVSIGEDNHVKTRGCLIMVFDVIVLFLRKQRCEPELLILPWHYFNYCHHVALCELINQRVEKLR